MTTIIRTLAAVSLVAVLPLLAQDSPKNKDEKKEKAPPAKQYTHAGNSAGKVVSLEDGKLTITVKMKSGRRTQDEKVDFDVAEDAKYRILNLPERLDEKHKPIPYTAQEKAKLRGPDTKLPGYTAESSAVKKGQMVEVTLGKLKPAPGTPRKKPGEEADKPVVTMIVILAEEVRPMDKKK
ncbi:MAG: hypothetical protein K1X57_09540 [Gemmataceae bacterium]|nr:hypothetical protein [Gemmataceae bacterium]